MESRASSIHDDLLVTEYTASPDLKDYVQSYWTGTFNIRSLGEWSRKVIPNGFIEIIIHLGDERCALFQRKQWNSSPPFTILGVHTKPYMVRFFRPVSVFAIRLNPEGVHQIFGVPAANLLEAYESAADVFDQNFADLCEKIRSTNSPAKQVRLSEDFLRDNMSKYFRSYDYVSHAARVIRMKSGKKMTEVHAEIPISPRQLQREFKMKMGITPKGYLRLARMNAIQEYLHGKPDPQFTRATYAYGFSDPSHLAREFRMLTGLSPSRFMEARDGFLINPLHSSATPG